MHGIGYMKRRGTVTVKETLVCGLRGLWHGRRSANVKRPSAEDERDEYRRLIKMADSNMRVWEMWQILLYFSCQDKEQSAPVKISICWLLVMCVSIITGNTNCFVFKLKLMLQILTILMYHFSHLFVYYLAPTSFSFQFNNLQIFK